ncbi:hypothetical protein EV06_1513 [Prochlorococcus sp. MIT 0602]|nr:hypothetical protein EV06_1513 [Prochlorococcus sp. MIT 0602]
MITFASISCFAIAGFAKEKLMIRISKRVKKRFIVRALL